MGDDPNGYPVYYLSYFNTFTFTASDGEYYFYKYNFGWLYYLSGTANTVGPTTDAYLYDFATDDVFYTSSDLYPYFYSFNLDTWLYYFEGSSPREFYDYRMGNYLYYPAGNNTLSH